MSEFRTPIKPPPQKQQPESLYIYHSSPYQSFTNPQGNSNSNLSVGMESFTSSEDGQPIDITTSFQNSFGNTNVSCISPDSDNQVAMQQKAKSLVEQLQAKINKTKERIKLEQTAKQENVNEYLKLSNDADRQQLQRIKAVFEKKNLKSAQVVAQLQRKLDAYDKKLKEITTQGLVSGHRPTKGKLKDVGQGLKEFFARDPTRSRDASPCAVGKVLTARNPATLPGVSKTRDTTQIFKNKYGSADNIASNIKLSGHEIPGRDDAQDQSITSQQRNGSEEEVSSGLSDSLASGEFFSMKHSATKNRDNDAGLSPIPQSNQQQKDTTTTTATQEPTVFQAKDLTTIINNLSEFQKTQYDLHCSVEALKAQLEQESMFHRQTLEEEHDRCERLEEQINDLTELHQNEVFNIKQEFIGMQEKLEYQLEERTRDMQELLLTCQTKINKMELQQQQLISMEGIENTSFRGLVTKLINVALALLAVILVLVSGVANLIGPFLQTRFRIVITAVAAAIVAVLWNNWTDVCRFVEQIYKPSGS